MFNSKFWTDWASLAHAHNLTPTHQYSRPGDICRHPWIPVFPGNGSNSWSCPFSPYPDLMLQYGSLCACCIDMPEETNIYIGSTCCIYGWCIIYRHAWRNKHLHCLDLLYIWVVYLSCKGSQEFQFRHRHLMSCQEDNLKILTPKGIWTLYSSLL
jgi:hypothetical protein